MRGLALGLAMVLAMAEAALAQSGLDRVEFDGSFSEIRGADHPDCAGIFAETDYHTKYFLVGPTRRTIVTNFSREDETGFWHGLTFVSNFGYNNDFYYEKLIDGAERDYRIDIYGFVDRNVVYMQAQVDALDEENVVVCRATAVYSGFH